MKKRIFALVAVMLLVATVVAGCTSPSTRIIVIDNDKTTVDYTEIAFFGFKADPLDFLVFERMLHGFMDENSTVQVTYEGLKGNDYWNALKKRADSNCVDDIFMIDQQRAISMHDTLSDVSKAINLDVFNNLVKSQVLQADGSVRFVPTTLASYCIYVNYDLLEECGFAAPTNYAEFAAICNDFASRGVTPIICNSRRALCTLVQAKSLFDVYKQPDSDKIIQSYNDNPTQLADQLKSGLQFVEEMFANHWIDPAATLLTNQTSTEESTNANGVTTTGDLLLFAQGKQPFVVTGGWAAQRLKKLLSDNEQTLNFGVHPFPILDDGCVLVMDVNNCVAVNANGNNVQTATKFLEYLTKPDSIWEFCDGQCCFSPLKGETRQPSEETLAPTAPYYTNGRAVIGTNYQLNMPLDSILIAVTNDMCKGKTAAEAFDRLTNLLTGKEVL